MKNLNQYLVGLLLLLTCVSCSKNKEKSGCLPVALIQPAFKFQVVDKNNGNDLFFSASPQYSLSDISVEFRDKLNKINILSPPDHLNSGSVDHFVYTIPQGKTADTCFVKIKGLKTDTLISTITSTTTDCGVSLSLSRVKVNKNVPVDYSKDITIVIKK
ncbi:hypothetical protein SNE25_28880 [Mucilaginibacter sabulilitoris]|uniref:Lipoprotein n=1 Tax=Mucilaginibacter sabulilitoris TaxID=1173583 RepID=A0ABZ0TMD6_9SPHI|nr:hypothetical protein [Mucilaginibacter sabulilitoris]WPU93338.1 hypothetical protein SNE25_28880 [Mucilaginibacter sabulilitoris]